VFTPIRTCNMGVLYVVVCGRVNLFSAHLTNWQEFHGTKSQVARFSLINGMSRRSTEADAERPSVMISTLEEEDWSVFTPSAGVWKRSLFVRFSGPKLTFGTA